VRAKKLWLQDVGKDVSFDMCDRELGKRFAAVYGKKITRLFSQKSE